LASLPFPKIGDVKEVVIIGNYGDGNIGDEALLDVLLKLISKNLGHIKIIVPSRAPSTLKKIHRKKFYPVNLVKGFYKAFWADALILGAGTIFSEHAGIGIYITTILVIFRRLILKKKTYFYGIGYSSTTPFLLKILAKIAFKVSDGIYVRDRFSRERIIRDLGIESVYPIPTRDLGLFLKESSFVPRYLEDIKRNKRGPLIGASLIYADPETNRKVINSFREFIMYLHDNYSATFCFLIFCPAFVSGKSDREIAEAILNQLPARVRKNVHILPYCSPSITLRIIRELDLVISMRYHGLVFAYKENRPFIAISFEDKHRSFLEEYGGESIDLENLTAKDLIRKFEYLYNMQLKDRPCTRKQ